MHDRCFDIAPKVVRVGDETMVTIRPLFDHCRFSPDGACRVSVYPTEGAGGGPVPHVLHVVAVDGVLRFRYRFVGEQEYVVLVEPESLDGRPPAEFRLYALEDDLYALRPYKGDVHMHSCRSDGRESPAYVAGASRRIGLDFMAVTDHHLYAPSLEAMRAFEPVETDLRIYPGEEVHPPDNPVHIINFGGSFSVNDRFQDSESFLAQVSALQDRLDDLPPEVDPYQYASCAWCFDRIREGGGLAVFCHPYWFTRYKYDVPEALSSALLERQPFDALELIGGYHLFEIESNNLQVARYHQERARGKQIPIVGVSDAHGCERGELFGWFYTIVFAPSLELSDLVQGVKTLYSVAVEVLPGGPPRAFGPFRLVKYAHYVLREIMPLHDELCVEEGRLMLDYLAGHEGAAEALCACKGRVQALYDRLWGGSVLPSTPSQGASGG